MTDVHVPTDLVDFWKSAIHFYCQINESRTLGHDLVQLNYDLTGGIVGHNAGPFAPQ